MADLSDFYRNYISLLNERDLTHLQQFVDEEVCYNGENINLKGYRELLEKDFDNIPDLHYKIEILVCEFPYIVSRLTYDCTPKGEFLGLQIDGKKVHFSENVFYRLKNGKIKEVFSVIDKPAIERQINT